MRKMFICLICSFCELAVKSKTLDELHASVVAASERIAPHVLHTPLLQSLELQQLVDNRVYIKLENEQTTGSFKLRGAFNKLCLLKENPATKDIYPITASSGNHGIACVHAMTKLDMRGTIFVSTAINSAKEEALQIMGAELKKYSGDCVVGEIQARQTAQDPDDFQPRETAAGEEKSQTKNQSHKTSTSNSTNSGSVTSKPEVISSSGGGGGSGDGGGDDGGERKGNKKDLPKDGAGDRAKQSESSSAKKRKEQAAGRIADLKPAKALVQKYAVRPAPIPPPPLRVLMEDGEYHVLEQKEWMTIFSWLNQSDLLTCSQVCKTWHRWAMHHSLWTHMGFPNTQLKQAHLIAIVKRQPVTLDLSWTNVSHRKLDWLLARLPHLRHLDLSGCSWAAVCALCSPSCPLLHSLNLSWVSGLVSGCVRDLVSPPVEQRPGVDHSLSRLHHCHTLNLSGANINTSAFPVLAHNLPKLTTLRLDFCVKLSDESIETLASSLPDLRVLSLSRCHGLTTDVFTYLSKLQRLESLEIQNCLKISHTAVENFVKNITCAKLEDNSGAIIFDRKSVSS